MAIPNRRKNNNIQVNSVSRCEIRHSGFTLVEILVVLGIVVLLMAILLPALGAARRTAGRMQSMSNLRNIGAVIEIYLSSNAQIYPVADPNQKYPYGCGIGIKFGYWSMSHNWPSVISSVMPWEELVAVAHSPGIERSIDDQRCGNPPSYVYSNSFIAKPELWDEIPEENLRDLLSLQRGVSATQVRYTSQKVIFWDSELGFLNNKPARIGHDLAELTPMLFADSHTESNVPAEAQAPLGNPFYFSDAEKVARLHNTPYGVHGWDYE